MNSQKLIQLFDFQRNRIWASVLALIVCRVRMNLMWPIVRKMQDHVWSQDTIEKFVDFNDDEGGLLVAAYKKVIKFNHQLLLYLVVKLFQPLTILGLLNLAIVALADSD
ncbi:hypothetical protein P8452_61032 [Trifolium repens]|nr:hypothetical protein P8452_61032 [Trifolium repens]